MQTLTQFLTHNKTDTDLVDLIDTLMVACKEIAIQLREGEGVQRQIELMDEDYYPSAGAMLTLAQRDWDAGLAVAAHEAMPVYLRDDVAWKKKDQQ